MEECGILIRQQSSPQLISMKTLFFITIAILACPILPAQREPNTIDLASLSVKQAEDLINNTEGGKIKRDLVTAAITSRRMDLIKLCFENYHTLGFFLEPVIQIEDKTFKDEIVLMILRTKSAFWPHDNPFHPGGIYSGIYLGEPFIDTIKRNLPDLPLSPNLPLSNDLIATHAERLKLADRLAAVIEKREKVISPPSAEHPLRRESPPTNPKTNHQDVQSMKPPSPEANANGTITQRIGKGWELWLAGVCVLLITAILIWRWKSKSIS
jgi:hypothetical protein